MARLHRGELDRLVEQRLVGNDAIPLDAARRRDDQLRLGVTNAGRQLVRSEAPEHDRMDGPDPRTREHRDGRLWDHRHVDDDPVALADALSDQRPSEASHLIQQFSIRKGPDGSRNRAVVDERRLVGPAVLDVPIEGVVTGVDHAAGEPAVERGP